MQPLVSLLVVFVSSSATFISADSRGAYITCLVGNNMDISRDKYHTVRALSDQS